MAAPHRSTASILGAPAGVRRLAGVEVAPSSPEAMSAYLLKELERWGKVVKETGIKLE